MIYLTSDKRQEIYINFRLNNTWKLISKLYDKCDAVSFAIVKSLFLRTNILFSSAYKVPQVVKYDRTCPGYEDFRGQLE